MNASWVVRQGDALEQLAELPDDSVHCVVTSPPYWGLRDYGVDGAYGLEPTLDEYLERMVAVFREVRRVLRDDGTLWLNMRGCVRGVWTAPTHPPASKQRTTEAVTSVAEHQNGWRDAGLKPKDLIGLPWRLAFALQDDGWWLRSDIIWAKPNPMPESVTDRPTRSHEHVFLLTKKPAIFLRRRRGAGAEWPERLARRVPDRVGHFRGMAHTPQTTGSISNHRRRQNSDRMG